MAKTKKKAAAAKVAPAAQKKTAKKAAKAAPVEDEDEEEEEQEESKPAKKAAKKTAKKGTMKLGSPEKTYQSIKDLIILMDTDIEKFLVDEVKSAGRRVRGHAQGIKKLCQQLRKEVQELANKRKGA